MATYTCDTAVSGYPVRKALGGQVMCLSAKVDLAAIGATLSAGDIVLLGKLPIGSTVVGRALLADGDVTSVFGWNLGTTDDPSQFGSVSCNGANTTSTNMSRFEAITASADYALSYKHAAGRVSVVTSASPVGTMRINVYYVEDT